MDGALKKKGISLSMQYLNETPLAQIKEKKMKTNHLKSLSILIIFSITMLIAQSPHTGKGEVIAIRILELKSDVDTTEFDKFAYEEFNPAYDGTAPGIKLSIAKSDRGTDVGSYVFLWTFDSQIVRDLMLPAEGNPTDWFLQIFEDQNLWDQWNKLGTYVVDGSLGKYNDYVVLK